MGAAPQCGDSAARGDGAFRDELSALGFIRAAAKPGDHLVDERVVGGAVDLRDIEPVLPGRERGDLPIAEMTAEQDDRPVCRERLVEMVDTMHLDPAVRRKYPNARQMRVLCRDPAKIVPHAADDRLDPVSREFWHRRAQVTPRPFRYAETRSDPARKRATEPGSGFERQHPHEGEEQRRAPGLDPTGPAKRP